MSVRVIDSGSSVRVVVEDDVSDNLLVNVQAMGAVGDGVTDDYAAFRAAFDAMLLLRVPMIVPRGIYRISQDLLVDMAAVKTVGFRMKGEEPHLSVLRFDNGAHFQLFGSNGDQFYPTITGVGFQGNRAGPVFEVGKPDYSDPINRPHFRLSAQNFNAGPDSVGATYHHVLNGFNDIEYNCGSGGSVGGQGRALVLRQAIMNQFFGACASADTCVSFEDGYSYANVFSAMDFENAKRCIVQTSIHAGPNTFVGGQYVYSSFGIQATAGGRLLIDNPNVNPSGGAVAENFVDPAKFRNVIVRGRPVGFVYPPLPASGVSATNTTGRDVLIVVGGGITSVIINDQQSNVFSGSRVTLFAGESITPIYTTDSYWQWSAL